MKPYRPSNRFDGGGVRLLFGACLLAGLVTGGVFFLVETYLFSLVLIFPFFIVSMPRSLLICSRTS